MTVAELLTRAATVLNDDDHVRWPLPELVNWLNDGVRAVVLAKPSASPQAVVLTLVEGTRQTLTDSTHLLILRVLCNVTSAGPPIVRGRAIRLTTRDILDTSEPDWHNPSKVRPRAEVRQAVYDEADPRAFYVYPANDGTGKIEAIVSALPAQVTPSGAPDDIASYGANLPLPEPYAIPLLDYVLYRAFSKDSTDGEAGRAQLHMQMFAQALGIKAQVENTNSPNARAKISA